MCTTKHRGFTLVEMIIFIVIVSVALVGILQVMNVTVQSSADPMVHKQAVALADSILEEILLKSYCDPDTVNASTTPPTCGANTVEASRDLWDDADDYNGKTNIDLGVPSELNTYVVAITVTPATLGTAPNNMAVKKITVTVTHSPETISLTGYRANY